VKISFTQFCTLCDISEMLKQKVYSIR